VGTVLVRRRGMRNNVDFYRRIWGENNLLLTVL